MESSQVIRHPLALDDVSKAAKAIGNVVTQTPLLVSLDAKAILGGRLLGTNALIVMPDDVPVAKIEATRALGTGTVATELYEQITALGTRLDAVLVPCGGAGTAATSTRPDFAN